MFVRRNLLRAVTGFVFVLALVGCGGGAQTAESAPSSAVSGAAEGTFDGPDGSKFTVKQGPGGQDVEAVFDIGSGYTDSMMSKKAKLATMDILNAAKEQFPKAATVTVKAKVGDAVVVTVNYSKTTLDKFDDFKRVSQDDIWQIADSGYIDPAFKA